MRVHRKQMYNLLLSLLVSGGCVLSGCQSREPQVDIETPAVDIEVKGDRQDSGESKLELETPTSALERRDDRREKILDAIDNVDVKVNDGSVKVDVNASEPK